MDFGFFVLTKNHEKKGQYLAILLPKKWPILRGIQITALCIGGFFILAEITFEIAWYLKDRSNLHVIAPESELVASFEKLALNDDSINKLESYVIRKWTSPVKVSFHGKFPDWHKKFLMFSMGSLSKLSGLEFKTVPATFKGGIFHLHFVEGESGMHKAARQHNLSASKLIAEVNCFAAMDAMMDGEIWHSIAVFARNEENNQTRRCLIEELTHGLGFMADAATYRPSIFSENTYPYELSLNDKILIRTLYDKRITPGMPRAEAMKVVREIIPELVAKTRAEGVEAPYQK